METRRESVKPAQAKGRTIYARPLIGCTSLLRKTVEFILYHVCLWLFFRCSLFGSKRGFEGESPDRGMILKMEVGQ